MWGLARKYTGYFDLEKADGIIKKLLFIFMLSLPHIITVLIFIILYPDKWLGILIIGLILPDIYFPLYQIQRKLFPKGKEYPFALVNLSVKTISHILVFILVIFFFFNQEYILALVGGLHVLTDMLGF